MGIDLLDRRAAYPFRLPDAGGARRLRSGDTPRLPDEGPQCRLHRRMIRPKTFRSRCLRSRQLRRRHLQSAADRCGPERPVQASSRAWCRGSAAAADCARGPADKP